MKCEGGGEVTITNICKQEASDVLEAPDVTEIPEAPKVLEVAESIPSTPVKPVTL